MRKTHQKNTIRYFILVVVFLSFLFFSGDFGLVDVQKTAIVMAVGVDREEDTFIVTSQIAIPQSSKQGKASETVQIVSRGKTVAQAFEEINAKTGWYPKLVFCHLVILGENTIKDNVFDALDFFLLDEYLSDNCLVATCDGLAKDILNVTALVDPSGSLAMQKVLSTHSESVGTVLASTLREFSIGYFSQSRSGYLPILKTQPQQEQVGKTGQPKPTVETTSSSSSQEGEGQGKQGENAQDKPVFSASETALFVGGRKVGELTKEQTFAFGAVKNKLRLAPYSVEKEGQTCTLNIRRNSTSQSFKLGEDGRAVLRAEIVMTAGLIDYSKALSLEEGKDAGDVPSGVFDAAEKRLEGQIQEVFELCKNCRCDLFGIVEQLQKREKKQFESLKNTILENAILNLSVTFRNVR